MSVFHFAQVGSADVWLGEWSQTVAAIGKFTPVLTLRRSRVASNVAWLYRYDRDMASVKLEKRS